MHKTVQRSLMVAAAMALAACQTAPPRPTLQPTAEEMREALKTMLVAHPDMSIPEFANSLKYDHPVSRDGSIYIGAWNCSPRNLSFDALFTASSMTLFEVSGRFDQDTRGHWRAIPHDLRTVNSQEVGDYWRASEVDKVHY